MKQDKPQVETPVREKRPKQFDTRMLDRLESYISQFRYWHSDRADPVDVYPYGYIESQKEAYRMELRNAAQAVAEALKD